MRSFDDKISVATERGGEIIDGDEEDIGSFCSGSECAGEEKEAENHR